MKKGTVLRGVEKADANTKKGAKAGAQVRGHFTRQTTSSISPAPMNKPGVSGQK